VQEASFGDDLSRAFASLKVSVRCLGFVSLVLAVGVMAFMLRDPLVIERSTTGEVFPLAAADSGRTSAEVDQFVRLALAIAENPRQEFRPSYFATEVRAVIERQRADLNRDSIEQNLLIHSIAITDSQARVKADRVMAKDELRAAIAENYQIDLREVPRTYENPYGIEVVGIATTTNQGKANESK
jgi:hypothetical protein